MYGPPFRSLVDGLLGHDPYAGLAGALKRSLVLSDEARGAAS